MNIEISNNSIKLKKEFNELDKFVFSFTDILKKYCDYVIVSGYVSILFGRSRATEDVDIIIKKLTKNEFKTFYKDLITNNFWFLNSDNFEHLYELLETKHSIRIAKKDEIIPNIELKFVKNLFDNETLNKKIKLILYDNEKNEKELYIPKLEIQIAYKKEILKSQKDIEDAFFLEELFKDKLDKNLLKEYSKFLKKSF